MQTVTLAEEFQIIIPEEIRKSLNLQPRQQLQISENNGRVELIPSVGISSLRGFVKGINTEFEREEDRI